jgi:hypothetical protein
MPTCRQQEFKKAILAGRVSVTSCRSLSAGISVSSSKSFSLQKLG